MSEPTEVPIFQGSVSLWMGWRSLAASGFIGLFGVGVLIAGLFQAPGFARTAMVVVGGAAFGANAILLPYLIVSIRCLRYTITNRLIEREKGVFLKRVDALDLARVKDVELTQSVVQRMLKIGTIEVYSSDQSDPTMRIEDIPNPRPVYEQLRNSVIALSQRRGIISMDR
ncbi:MAG: PH domain-containing protein [Planctomycetota bacterium]|nr:PH domain-containing protein [Planctomycetota bacterium]